MRDFRNGMSGYTKNGQLVLVMNHGKMVGCFLPLRQTNEIPIELKKAFLETLGQQFAARLSAGKIGENQILSDFHAFKKSRRR